MKLRPALSQPFLVAFAALALSLAGEVASAQPAPPSNGFRVVGVLWYLRSHAAMDDLTLVYGGLQGSAALVYRDYTNEKSHWFFLEGGNLYVSSDASAPWYTSTNQRGKFITTTRPFDWSLPKDGNRRVLSWLLVDLWDLSQLPSTNPDDEGELYRIRHAPFLTGKGWTGGKGATWAEVQDLCAQLGLTPDPQTPTIGYVNQQLPINGTLMEPGTGDTLKVWFDQTPSSVLPLSVGDTFMGPMLVEDPDGDGVVTVPIELTAEHRDDAMSPIRKPDGTPVNRIRKDLFVKLPPDARNHKVTVKNSEPGDRMILTAWKVVGGSLVSIPSADRPYTAQLGMQPMLEYLHDSDDIVIMAEFDTRNTGTAVLRISW